MAIPSLYFTDFCYGKLGSYEEFGGRITHCNLSKSNKSGLAAMVIDTVVSISSLIIGILGATYVISLPAATSYALIGISCTITLLWIAMIVYQARQA